MAAMALATRASSSMAGGGGDVEAAVVPALASVAMASGGYGSSLFNTVLNQCS